jgi:hypothetical protein
MCVSCSMGYLVAAVQATSILSCFAVLRRSHHVLHPSQPFLWQRSSPRVNAAVLPVILILTLLL